MKKFTFFTFMMATFLIAGFSVYGNKVTDIIANSKNHSILETALIEAQLIDDLEGAGPFTVFAPTDNAFSALPEGTIEALLTDPQGILTDILLYHVSSGIILSTDLENGMKAKTLNGKDFLVTINKTGIYINNSKVTVADIQADNGVVHVLNTVLIPQEDVEIMETESFGNILVDAYGRTLYFFSQDADGLSMCNASCLLIWPLFYDEDLNVGTGLNSSDFENIDRGDGKMQTTYKGWPLYNYTNDPRPGLIHGDGVLNKWFVVQADYTIMLAESQLVGNDGNNYKGDYTIGEEFTQYFTDANGNTLYTWKNDQYNSNRFTKSDFSNNGFWPIYEQNEIIVPSNLNPVDFSTINVHGKTQLTYKGWPLYYFGGDMMIRGSNKGISVPAPGIWPVPVSDMMMADKYPTVVDIVVGSPDHTTLTAALTAAGLVETLQGEGPFTVFAPTDDAFAALPDGLVDTLLLNPSGALTDILLYHVVAGKAMSSDLSDGQVIETLFGKDVMVKITNEGVYINDAMVTVADLEADNGVVHVIDAVLVPTTTDISVVEEISLQIYPNPATDFIKVESSANGILRVRDIAGRVVVERMLETSIERIDVTTFESGIYLVSVQEGNSVETKKLIVR